MNRYEIIIYRSVEDQAFIAEVPEFPGCSVHGPTQEAAIANAQEAVALWIETAEEFGGPVPELKGRRLVLA
jgi:predicted RNase H-like HicB family nuclease